MVGNHVYGFSRIKGSNPLLSVFLERPVGQVVKTPPFHGGNMGSNPVRVTSWRISSVGRASALQAEGHRFEPCILHHDKTKASTISQWSLALFVLPE